MLLFRLCYTAVVIFQRPATIAPHTI